MAHRKNTYSLIVSGRGGIILAITPPGKYKELRRSGEFRVPKSVWKLVEAVVNKMATPHCDGDVDTISYKKGTN